VSKEWTKRCDTKHIIYILHYNDFWIRKQNIIAITNWEKITLAKHSRKTTTSLWIPVLFFVFLLFYLCVFVKKQLSESEKEKKSKNQSKQWKKKSKNFEKKVEKFLHFHFFNFVTYRWWINIFCYIFSMWICY